jgi:hypothetical protein
MFYVFVSLRLLSWNIRSLIQLCQGCHSFILRNHKACHQWMQSLNNWNRPLDAYRGLHIRKLNATLKPHNALIELGQSRYVSSISNSMFKLDDINYSLVCITNFHHEPYVEGGVLLPAIKLQHKLSSIYNIYERYKLRYICR